MGTVHLMELQRLLRAITDFLTAGDHPFALVGGLALAAYGRVRTTLDLDLVVDGGAQDALVAFLEATGYETLHRSPGYSNHLHGDRDWGRVDVVYVRGETSQALFAGASPMAGPGGVTIPIPRPEHLAAMKVLAMKNDPERTLQELADIRYLMTLPGVDREEIRGYFSRHGLEERYRELAAGL